MLGPLITVPVAIRIGDEQSSCDLEALSVSYRRAGLPGTSGGHLPGIAIDGNSMEVHCPGVNGCSYRRPAARTCSRCCAV